MHEAGEEEIGLAITYEFESLETYILYELQSEVIIEHAEILHNELSDEKKFDWDAILQGYELEAVNEWGIYWVIFAMLQGNAFTYLMKLKKLGSRSKLLFTF